MAKPHMLITNWDEFPDIKGIQWSNNRAHRTICKCGYSEIYHVTTCPKCGNTEWTRNACNTNNIRFEFVKNFGLSYSYKRFYDLVTIQETGRVDTSIVKRKANTTTYDLFNPSIYGSSATPFFNWIKSDPEIAADPFMQLVLDIMNGYPEYFTQEQSSSFAYTMQFCKKLFENEPSNYNFNFAKKYIEVFGFSGLYIGNRLKPNPSQLLEKVELADDVTRIIISDSINLMEHYLCDRIAPQKVESELINFLIAYWKEGYLTDQFLYEFLEEAKTNKLYKKYYQEIVSYIKDQFATIITRRFNATSMIDAFVEWLENGGVFTSVKDYFTTVNIDMFTKSYQKNKIMDAFSDLYENPMDMILKIAEMK